MCLVIAQTLLDILCHNFYKLACHSNAITVGNWVLLYDDKRELIGKWPSHVPVACKSWKFTRPVSRRRSRAVERKQKSVSFDDAQ